jgi:hypothetical protein
MLHFIEWESCHGIGTTLVHLHVMPGLVPGTHVFLSYGGAV